MKIVAIIVLYNNDNNKTFNNVERISSQVDSVCLIDNSDFSAKTRFECISNSVYLPQYKNLGIAAAQNIGIKYAINEGFEYILFADPDSEIPSGCVRQLLLSYNTISESNVLIGAIGARPYNEKNNLPYSFEESYIENNNDLEVTELSYTMNSISIINTNLFKEVGMMDERLFIDGVDCEWCWRANYLYGYRFFIDNRVKIKHNLGVANKTFFKKRLSISSPIRLYFQFRNYLWLRNCTYVPSRWKKVNQKKFVVKLFYYPLFVSPRLKYLKFILKGIKDGLINKKLFEEKINLSCQF